MRELTSLTESDRKIALDRCRILQPHLQDGRALSVVAREAGVAYSTAQRSVRLYRRFGLSALARKERSDRGQRAALGLSTGQLVAGLLAGALGCVAGTLGGAKARAFGAKLIGWDLPAALAEDAIPSRSPCRLYFFCSEAEA